MVEVTDCCTSMFISLPRPNEQPLCCAVLTFLTGNVKMSTQGKSVEIHYVNISLSLAAI